MSLRKSNRTRLVIGAPIVLLFIVGCLGWFHLFRDVDIHYDSDVDLFKYGSVGNEGPGGMPYWIWRALPQVFADKLPGKGYASLGFTYEDGRDVPLGLTRKTIGFDRVGVNCALCHTSKYRETPSAEPVYIYAGTNASFDAQRYFNFLFACANDSRFIADTLMAAIDELADLSLTRRLLYRHVLIPKTKEALLAMQERLSWWYDIPEAGPGRWIAFNDLKFHFAKLPQDGSIGNPDVPSLWNLRPRQEAKSFHWDGMSDDLGKIMQNAFVGGGATEKTIDRTVLRRLQDWYMDVPPPAYPFAVEQELAEEGSAVFEEHCASCHEIGRPGAGRNIPIDVIGTDGHRFDLITDDLPDAYNTFAKEEYGWPEEWQIRKTRGYNAPFLDGIWLRAPYLHNGSVPNITELLKPPEQRVPVFYRGYDVYDQENVGFVAHGPAAEAHFRYDTSLPGNGNGGHRFGTTLSSRAKRALREYLKTL